jgi:predicted NodU family carbamoyl transferase
VMGEPIVNSPRDAIRCFSIPGWMYSSSEILC